jgi:uncharacterized protein
MVIACLKIKIRTPWVHTLKEKRMVVKSLSAKIRNKYNVSVSEVEEQDIHQITVLGLACVTQDTSHADSILDHVINFIENNTEGEILQIDRDLIKE